PAAAHGDGEVVAASEPDRFDDVAGPRADGDQAGATVDGAVPDSPALVIGRVLRSNHLTPQGARQRLHCRLVERLAGHLPTRHFGEPTPALGVRAYVSSARFIGEATNVRSARPPPWRRARRCAWLVEPRPPRCLAPPPRLPPPGPSTARPGPPATPGRTGTDRHRL